MAQARESVVALQGSLDNSLRNANSNNINISKLVDQINESNQYIRHLVEVKSKSDSLNMVLTNNLTRSLSREELKEVDVQVLKGVVYISLADNMLYKSGSYEVNDRAEQTLSKIAKIITDYKDYDVLIEGNTDNVPINTTTDKMKNIRNNWDLSCLRAASVAQYLQDRFGVNPKRLTAGGRGEYNPLATNDTELGKQRNRRTQIIITQSLISLWISLVRLQRLRLQSNLIMNNDVLFLILQRCPRRYMWILGVFSVYMIYFCGKCLGEVLWYLLH